jgi:pimeloyl-ACP methyl ester carboxylesterase
MIRGAFLNAPQASSVFRYGGTSELCVVDSINTLVVLGGLYDGIGSPRYFGEICEVLGEDYAVIQPSLSSLGHGFGISSLDRDVWELDRVIEAYLPNARKIAILGHSTGAQIATMYCKKGKFKERINRVFLQGGVSDREYAESSNSRLAGDLKLAREMISQGKGFELMPRNADIAPITADRYFSLFAKGGDDDMFSSDLTDMELEIHVGHLRNFNAFIIFSMNDEYVPSSIDKRLLLHRLSRITNAKVLELETNHDLSNSESARKDFLSFLCKNL